MKNKEVKNTQINLDEQKENESVRFGMYIISHKCRFDAACESFGYSIQDGLEVFETLMMTDYELWKDAANVSEAIKFENK